MHHEDCQFRTHITVEIGRRSLDTLPLSGFKPIHSLDTEWTHSLYWISADKPFLHFSFSNKNLPTERSCGRRHFSLQLHAYVAIAQQELPLTVIIVDADVHQTVSSCTSAGMEEELSLANELGPWLKSDILCEFGDLLDDGGEELNAFGGKEAITLGTEDLLIDNRKSLGSKAQSRQSLTPPEEVIFFATLQGYTRSPARENRASNI